MNGGMGVALVSVIVPVLNEERLLRDTLECLKKQTFSDFELLVVDNGSHDGTANIARE